MTVNDVPRDETAGQAAANVGPARARRDAASSMMKSNSRSDAAVRHRDVGIAQQDSTHRGAARTIAAPGGLWIALDRGERRRAGRAAAASDMGPAAEPASSTVGSFRQIAHSSARHHTLLHRSSSRPRKHGERGAPTIKRRSHDLDHTNPPQLRLT